MKKGSKEVRLEAQTVEPDGLGPILGRRPNLSASVSSSVKWSQDWFRFMTGGKDTKD